MSEEQQRSDADIDPTADEKATTVEATRPPSQSAAGNDKSLPAGLRYALSILILAGAAAAAYGLSLLATPTDSQPPTALVPKVILQRADTYSGNIELLVSGTVVPHKEITLAAEVSGKVLKKYPECSAGNFVEKGVPLIEIDPESYQLAVNTAKAELVQSEKRIGEVNKQITGERRNLELANQDYKIQNREFERSKRLGSAISRSELDQARRGVNAALTQVTARTNAIDGLTANRETLQAAMKLAEQRLKQSELNLRRTVVKAPTTGLIVSESVQQDAFVRQGEMVLRFENKEVSEVRCNLTTTDLDWIRKNSKDTEKASSIYQLPKTAVKIFDASEPDVVWQGVLERFSGIGRDPITKTTPCRIMVQEPIVQSKNGPRALDRGMFVKCRIEVQTSAGDASNDLVSFSERALHPNGVVWFVRDKKLMKSPIDVVDRVKWKNDETGKREVSIVARVKGGDLKPGDTVVVSPLGQPSVGAEVIIDAGEDEKAAKEEMASEPPESVAATDSGEAEKTN